MEINVFESTDKDETYDYYTFFRKAGKGEHIWDDDGMIFAIVGTNHPQPILDVVKKALEDYYASQS